MKVESANDAQVQNIWRTSSISCKQNSNKAISNYCLTICVLDCRPMYNKSIVLFGFFYVSSVLDCRPRVNDDKLSLSQCRDDRRMRKTHDVLKALGIIILHNQMYECESKIIDTLGRLPGSTRTLLAVGSPFYLMCSETKR